MVNYHRIRWTNEDFKNLQKAISNFNRKISRLQKNEKIKEYLPEKISYKEEKKKIKTRYELNYFINSLKKFTQYGDPEIVEVDNSIKITKWEYKLLKVLKKRRLKSLYNTLEEYGETEYKEVKPYTSIKEDDTRAQIKNLEKIFEVDSYSELKRNKERLYNIGRSDYEFKRAYIYRENYMEVMKKYENFSGYELLINKLNKIKNPIKFYEYVSKSEIAVDLTYQSDEVYTQEEFNRFLEEFGIKNE